MTDTGDEHRPPRRVPRVVVVSLVSLLSVAVVIAGGVGFFRLGIDAARDGPEQEAPPTDIGFRWDDGAAGLLVADPKFNLVRAWVESHILANDYDAAYPGYVTATTSDVFYASLGFKNLPDSRVGTYRLRIVAFSAETNVTNAQVCVDGLRVSSIVDGKPLEVRPLSWYALDLTFQRPVEPPMSELTGLSGELPSDQPLPPPDVFGDWAATSATTVESDACALWWAGGYGPRGRLAGPSSEPQPPVDEDEPGW